MRHQNDLPSGEVFRQQVQNRLSVLHVEANQYTFVEETSSLGYSETGGTVFRRPASERIARLMMGKYICCV